MRRWRMCDRYRRDGRRGRLDTFLGKVFIGYALADMFICPGVRDILADGLLIFTVSVGLSLEIL